MDLSFLVERKYKDIYVLIAVELPLNNNKIKDSKLIVSI